MKKISIIDYGCGNILSLSRALMEIGLDCKKTKNQNEILDSDLLILPGVGSFHNAMELLNKHNLKEAINNFVTVKQKPMIGICLGMQLMLTKSFELGEHNGLNLIEGEVVPIRKLSKLDRIKVPHVGWSKILKTDFISQALSDKDFYFVHSYVSKTKNKNETVAYSNYQDIKIPAVIKKNNIVGCQFHPEKSGRIGLSLFKHLINRLLKS